MRIHLFLLVLALAVVPSGPVGTAWGIQPPEEGAPERQREGRERDRGPRGGGPGMMGRGAPIGRATLLGSEQVREELGIDETMSETIRAALDAYREDARDARPDFRRLRDMSEEDRAKELERLKIASDELTKKSDETLSVLLEPEQLERLDQITLQVRMRTNPIGALKDPALREQLGVTEEQATQLDEVETMARERMDEIREELRAGSESGERPDFETMREIVEKNRKEFGEMAMVTLTGEQKTLLSTMQGEEFELDLSRLGRGEGPGFGRDGGRSGGGDRPEGDRRRRPPADDETPE